VKCCNHDHVKHSPFPCMHTFLTHCEHAIGAPETAASFELERVNPEGPEVTQEMEVQPARPEGLERKLSALVTSPLRS